VKIQAVVEKEQKHIKDGETDGALETKDSTHEAYNDDGEKGELPHNVEEGGKHIIVSNLPNETQTKAIEKQEDDAGDDDTLPSL